MKKSRLVWLGALFALVAMLGANGGTGQPETADAQAAALTICKAGAATGTFTFRVARQDGTGTPGVSNAISSGQCTSFAGVDQGTPLVITEQAGTGVVNVTDISVQCAGASGTPNLSAGTLTITIPAGGAVACNVTFTNAPPATVAVNKVCVNAPAGFNTVTLSVGGFTQAVACGASIAARPVAVGTSITVGELAGNVPTGATATISCTGATSPVTAGGAATFTPAAGQTIVCTVTNTFGATGGTTVVVNKVCVNAAIGAIFTLNIGTTASTGILCGAGTAVTTVTAGTSITVGELAANVPTGATATITCTGATSPVYTAGTAVFTPAAGQTIVCTVTNTFAAATVGSITIIKQGGTGTNFSFTGTGGIGNFTLAGGAQQVFTPTAGGSFTVTEQGNPNFSVVVTCTGATNTGTGSSATFVLGATNVVCTFTNTVIPLPITAQSKICRPYTPVASVVECDLSVLLGAAGLPAGATLDITVTGATVRSDFGEIAITNCPGATQTVVGGVIRITAPAAGCPANTVIVISEKLNCQGTNVITQRVDARRAGLELIVGTSTVTATGPGGQPFTFCATAPIVNPVISGATKICRVYTPIAGVLDCDLNLPLGGPAGIPGGATITVTLAPASAAAFRFDGALDVAVVQGCPGATVTASGANTFTVTAPAGGCPFPATIVISQKINCLSNITPGLLSETVLVRDSAGAVIGTAAPGVVVPFTGPGGQPLSFPCATGQTATAVKVCQPVVDGVPAATATQVFTRVGQVTTCTVTITNTSAGQVSPAGNVTVTLSNASFAGAADSSAVVTNIGAVGVGGTTATFPCTAIAATAAGFAQCSFTESFVAGPNACTTIGQTITSITGGPFSFSFSPIVANSSVAGSPQIFVLPKIDSGIVCPGQVSGFAGNDLRFVLRCNQFASLSAELQAATAGVIPGPIGGAGNVLALGILPSAIVCEAGFLATGDAINAPFRPAAPGTIEASSLNGTLVDLRGGVTTNLRIQCGGAAVTNLDNPINIGLNIDVNTCLGVRFGVVGLGVGFVELRARYEPNSAAAAAGVREREATGQVAFIAPSVAVNLLLNPNPVGVGQTGTATARFNRATVFAGELLINPQTGIPLTVSLGTPLNGTVTFTSSNAAVASFTGGLFSGETTTGVVPGVATSQFVVSGSGASVSVRCGTTTPIFASSGIPNIVTAGSFSSFFGGCVDASAAYRGNLIGITTITATFTADLPGAFGTAGLSAGFTGAGVNSSFGTVLGSNVGPLFDLVGGFGTNTAQANLEVVQLAATTQRLVPGCNNVVAPAGETVAQVAARVDPASAVISVWKQIPGTVMFQGAAVGQAVPAGVSNLTNVLALDAIFICVNAAATYRIT